MIKLIISLYMVHPSVKIESVKGRFHKVSFSEVIMVGCRNLSSLEVERVMEAVKGDARGAALICLGLRSGFRISEMLSLRVSSIYQNRKMLDYVTVPRRFMKKKIEGRTIPLHSEAKIHLAELLDEMKAKGQLLPDSFLFQSRKGENKALTRIGAWQLLKAVFEKAGVTGGCLSCHSLRKTYAHVLYRRLNYNIILTAASLGHKNVNSSYHYLSANNSEVEAAILAA